MTTGPAAVVLLADRHRQLSLFAAAIAGQPVAIHAFEGLPSLVRGPLGRADWLPGGVADGAAGEADCVVLPALACLPANAQHDLAALRVEVLRQLGVGSQAGAAALQAQLAESRRPVLLRRLFRMAERVRADAALPALYPGAVQALARARCEALARRSPVQPGRRLAGLVDALHRFALGAPRDALLAQDASGQLAPLLDALAGLHNGHATVMDSLSVAQWQLHVLATPGRWLSGRWVVDATMALAPSEGVPGPASRRTAASALSVSSSISQLRARAQNKARRDRKSVV